MKTTISWVVKAVTRGVVGRNRVAKTVKGSVRTRRFLSCSLRRWVRQGLRKRFSLQVFVRRFVSESFACQWLKRRFYNSAISKHVIRARIMVEMGSHPTKRFLFNHTTPFSAKGLEKSLCDFTGSIFVQCENSVIKNQSPRAVATQQILNVLIHRKSAHKTLLEKDPDTFDFVCQVRPRATRGSNVVFSDLWSTRHNSQNFLIS